MTTEAIIELNEDIRRTLRATLRGVQSPPPKEFLTQNYSYLDAWREHKNVIFVIHWLIILLIWFLYCSRLGPFHSLLKKKRTTSWNSTKYKALTSVRPFSDYFYPTIDTRSNHHLALGFYTEGVR